MQTIIEKIDQRLKYDDCVVIDRDEFIELQELMLDTDELYNSAQKEIEELESKHKQLAMACEILEDIYECIDECIDDDGTVTPSDKDLLGRRIKSAVKFVENIRDSK